MAHAFSAYGHAPAPGPMKGLRIGFSVLRLWRLCCCSCACFVGFWVRFVFLLGFVLGFRLWRLTCCFRACFVWGRFLFCSLLVFGFQGPDCVELVLRFFSLTFLSSKGFTHLISHS